jgi:hypothetical protein
MVSSAMLHCVALVRNYVLEELSASFIRVTRIGELGTMLAVTSNRRTLRRNTSSLIMKNGLSVYPNTNTYVCMCTSLSPEQIYILFTFSIREFMHPRMVLDESEHSSSKNWGVSKRCQNTKKLFSQKWP